MIDEEFFLKLPEEAFPLYERHVHQICFAEDWDSRQHDEFERDYINHICEFVIIYNIDLGIDYEVPQPGGEFWDYYHQFKQRVKKYSARSSLRRLSRMKAGTAGIYILPQSVKLEIHHFINRIRQLLAEAELSPQKRDALAKKLNAFSEEVDRDRTKIDALAAAWVWTKREIKDGVEVLNPVLNKLENILDKFTKATELPDILSLPKPSDKLEAPQKRIEGPEPKQQTSYDDLDNNIPF